MKKLVIMPGGFHPFHAGHMALYRSAVENFPSADVFVAATADTSNRPFPFATKKLLAKQAGVPVNRFIQVKSPFRAEEITQMYDPDSTVLIFVRSDKDALKQPQAGGTRRDGSPSYLQPYRRNKLQPMSQHAYMAYLPTVQFGPGMTSATEIRAKWPGMSNEEKQELIKQLYPAVAENSAAAGKIKDILDVIMDTQVGEALQGAPMGAGADGLDPGVQEATLINDPEQGHLIRPDGGMGTWDEASLRSNLVKKFRAIVDMLQSRKYRSIYHVIYEAGAMQNMIQALGQYDAFMDRQGRRPLARGREINLTDYIEEKSSASD
jgi:hypothetical protein